MKPDNTLSPNECTKVVAVLLSRAELQEIEALAMLDHAGISNPSTESLSVIAKCRTAMGWFA